MTRVLRYAALAVVALSLVGYVLVSQSDSARTKPSEATTRPSTRGVDVARAALAGAVDHFTVINEGSFTLYLTSIAKGGSKRTYMQRIRTEYDMARGMIESELDEYGLNLKIRVLESDGVYFKARVDDKVDACWTHVSIKKFKSLPVVQFAFDLGPDSAFEDLMEHAQAQSIKPDRDDPSLDVVTMRVPVLDVLRLSAAAASLEHAEELNGYTARMDVDLHLRGSEVTALDFDLVPVLKVLNAVGVGPGRLPGPETLKTLKPRGFLELNDTHDSFKVTVPSPVCPLGTAIPDFTVI